LILGFIGFLSCQRKIVRTIVNTPRNHVVLTKVEPGEYIHFDMETAITGSLLNSSSISNITELELDFNRWMYFT